jgi:chorismate dehydratase
MLSSLSGAPLCQKWLETNCLTECLLVKDSSSTLSRMLAEGELDLGFVCTAQYALYPERYKLLAGLSVTASGPAGSLFLFSHLPLDQLDQMPVLLASESRSASLLAEIILEEFTGVKPVYCFEDAAGDSQEQYRAVLAAGDEALKMMNDSSYLYQFDLGDIWKRKTSLPFVCDVCAVREEFCQSEAQLLTDIHNQLLRCRDEGEGDIVKLCEVSAAELALSNKECCDYLAGIEYDLAVQKKESIETFFRILIKRGYIEEAALPLKLVATVS